MRADAAMYQAKAAGRNMYKFYNQAIQSEVEERLKMEGSLRKALFRKEFFLEYQPKLNIQKNILVGYEALIRWNHPKLGLIPPNDFIPLAEKTSLIKPIGEWVLREACKQNKIWCDSGISQVPVAVNISAKQCEDKNLIKLIQNILKETNLDPSFLELELTESVAMSKPKMFIEMLLECQKLGIKTSIDDFGTGYCSLDYLRKFPVNTLKIDKVFIDEIVSKYKNSSIVKSIISLGHSLNLKIIAEGVESEDQLEQLKNSSCDEVQGYFLSRPLPAKEISNFVKNFDN